MPGRAEATPEKLKQDDGPDGVRRFHLKNNAAPADPFSRYQTREYHHHPQRAYLPDRLWHCSPVPARAERYRPAWHTGLRGSETVWPPRPYNATTRHLWPGSDSANPAHRQRTAGDHARRHPSGASTRYPQRPAKLPRAHAGTRCHSTPAQHGRGEADPPGDQSAATGAKNQSRRCLSLGTTQGDLWGFLPLPAPAAFHRSPVYRGAGLATVLAPLSAVPGCARDHP